MGEMLPASKAHFSLNFYLLLLHASKLAVRGFRRKIFTQLLLLCFSLFILASTWVSQNRVNPMLFLPNFWLDVLWTFHQLLSFEGKAGKT